MQKIKAGSYIKQFLSPGGTRRQMKELMGLMLLAQALATVLPNAIANAHLSIIDLLILLPTAFLVVMAWTITKISIQVKLIWLLYIWSIAVLVSGGTMYHSHRADIIIGLGWNIAVYINERRGYISFVDYMIFMLLGLGGLGFCIYYSIITPSLPSYNTIPILATGLFFFVFNSYILIIDFKYGKHQMDYFERQFDKINELSTALSSILMLDKPIKDIMWDVTQVCIPLLGLEDFVIYLYDERKNTLVQTAAWGDKKSLDTAVINPIEIKPGEGVVGTVYSTKKPLLIHDINLFENYIVDDAHRLSELAVPILIGDTVFGVIDSEHSQKNYFQHNHLQIFNVIAAFCSIKIAQEDLRAQKLQSEKQKLEVMKLRELEQLKNKFVTNISHDLKTPLSLILGPANQIYKKSSEDFTKEQAMYIIKNTDHLMSMVEQLLQLNRIDRGIEPSQIDAVSLNTTMQNIKTQYTPMATETGVELNIQVEGIITAITDGYKLSQCIHNLLQNSFKYTNRGGKINITISRQSNEQIKIVCSDTGIGIAPENQAKVFERFFKIDVNNHKGTGIGLSLVKEYVNQLNGDIKMSSVPGEGTTFTIALPDLIIPPEQETAGTNGLLPEQDDIIDDKVPLVLIAEDHKELNAFVAQSLQNENYRCLQAYNGKDAMLLAEKYMPDLVITDLMMPEMTGEELVEKLRESDTTGHIPLVVLTAKNQVDDRIELYNIGADNYIPKPFKMEELIAVVDNTIKQRKILRDKFYEKYMPFTNEVSPIDTTTDISTENLPTDPIVIKCMHYILEKLDDPELNVNTLGTAMGLGRNKLQKELKKATGLTPVEFIRSVRLKEAYKILSNADNKYNLSEIAYMTGFSNLSYFSRTFKSQFGYAPSEIASNIHT